MPQVTVEPSEHLQTLAAVAVRPVTSGAALTAAVCIPAVSEELAELRPLADTGDEATFARFQALSRAAREIEARALEAKDDAKLNEATDGLVA